MKRERISVEQAAEMIGIPAHTIKGIMRADAGREHKVLPIGMYYIKNGCKRGMFYIFKNQVEEYLNGKY